jgi:selenophosphate synthase
MRSPFLAKGKTLDDSEPAIQLPQTGVVRTGQIAQE